MKITCKDRGFLLYEQPLTNEISGMTSNRDMKSVMKDDGSDTKENLTQEKRSVIFHWLPDNSLELFDFFIALIHLKNWMQILYLTHPNFPLGSGSRKRSFSFF